MALDWTPFEAIYLLNPFAEAAWTSHEEVAVRMDRFFARSSELTSCF